MSTLSLYHRILDEDRKQQQEQYLTRLELGLGQTALESLIVVANYEHYNTVQRFDLATERFYIVRYERLYGDQLS